MVLTDREQVTAGPRVERSLWAALSRGPAERTLRLPHDGDACFPLDALFERAERTAGQIVTCVGAAAPPRRIALLMANGEPWIRGFLAALRCAAAAVPLPLPASFSGSDSYLEHVARILRDAGVSALLFDESTARLAGHLTRRHPVTVPLVEVSSPPAGGPASALPDHARAGDEAVVQYTSGSTGRPKGVVLTHDNVLAGLGLIGDALDFGPGQSMGSWLPLFHDMGLFGNLAMLARGGSLVQWRPANFVRDPGRWLAGFAEHRCTIMAAPNFAYELLAGLAERGQEPDVDLSSCRVAVNGAEQVDHRTVERFETLYRRHGLGAGAMRPAYGLAEATLAVTFRHPAATPATLAVDRFNLRDGDRVRALDPAAPEARVVVSVGAAAAGIRLRVASASRPRPEGVVGEVEVRGAPVTSGYLGWPPGEQPFTPDGWLRTGDLGFLAAGELFVVGRRKDMIVVRGQNIHADDVEQLVHGLLGGEASRCAAFAAERAGPGEAMVVLVETGDGDGDGAAARARDLERAVRLQLGLDAISVVGVPRRWIPVTTSGKVKRAAARRRYEGASA